MFWRNQKGQALVEFALVLPILLLLLLGIVEFGRIFHAQLVIDQAARDAARYGTITKDDTKIRDIINNQTSMLDENYVTSSIFPSGGSRRSGDAVTITIDYSIPLFVPLISNMLPNPFPVKTTISMRVE